MWKVICLHRTAYCVPQLPKHISTRKVKVGGERTYLNLYKYFMVNLSLKVKIKYNKMGLQCGFTIINKRDGLTNARTDS